MCRDFSPAVYSSYMSGAKFAQWFWAEGCVKLKVDDIQFDKAI